MLPIKGLKALSLEDLKELLYKGLINICEYNDECNKTIGGQYVPLSYIKR